MTTTVKELAELGLNKAAATVIGDRLLASKMRTAFEHYRMVTPAIFERFAVELRAKSEKKTGKMNAWGAYIAFDALKLTPLENYADVPPREVLDELKKARGLACFDRFEVATIESVEVIPDPVLFGVIIDCPDKFAVCEWGNDVKIADILREDEG